MSLLSNHLEQITLSSQSIGELEFRQSNPFTNALLHNQEITALIRDTEPHERGLFSIDPSIRYSNGQARASTHPGDAAARRRTTQFTGQPNSSAVARVLGNDMLRKIQSSNRDSSRGRGVDIEVLLQGVEKLCAAYEVTGTIDRVNNLRSKHQRIITSIETYEGKISKQQSSLSRFDQVGVDTETTTTRDSHMVQTVTDEDLQAEEELIHELETRKRELEARVAGMERDLGGLRT